MTHEELSDNVAKALADMSPITEWGTQHMIMGDDIPRIREVAKAVLRAAKAYRSGPTTREITVDLGCGSKSVRISFVIPASVGPGAFFERFGAYIAANGPSVAAQIEDNDSGN